MTDLLQTLVTTVALGSLYALIALGYTMVYGILKFINFAHSDVVVLGAWLSFVIATKVLPLMGVDPKDAPWWAGGVVLVLAMIGCGLVGFTVERLAYKPLRRAPRLNVLITAIGVSLLMQNAGQLPFIFGTQPATMPGLISSQPLTTIKPTADSPGVNILWVDVAVVLTSLLLMTALQYLVYRTKLGQAMRAVSYDTRTAALMGIPVDRVISFTFVLGSMLAAAAGFLFALKYTKVGQTAETTWVLLGLKAFVAAVVGGIGNIRGAMLGGFAIAFVEQFGIYLTGVPALRDVFVFAVLILVLLIKPSGILGKAVREKV